MLNDLHVFISLMLISVVACHQVGYRPFSLGFSKSLSEWIGSNLKKDNYHVTWAFDHQAAIDMFSSYR
jgi:hypothetical protein